MNLPVGAPFPKVGKYVNLVRNSNCKLANNSICQRVLSTSWPAASQVQYAGRAGCADQTPHSQNLAAPRQKWRAAKSTRNCVLLRTQLPPGFRQHVIESFYQVPKVTSADIFDKFDSVHCTVSECTSHNLTARHVNLCGSD